MKAAHRLVTGEWRNCSQPEACLTQPHLLGVNAAEAALVPLPVLLDLLGPIYPPDAINDLGEKIWHDRDGLNHRDGDLPAFIFPDGSMEWWQHGQIHRDWDKPAIVKADGFMTWVHHNKRHRFDAPAVITPGGAQHWYRFGERDRAGDLPATIREDGTQEWWARGKLHRTQGPAVIKPDGSVEYWQDNNRIGAASSASLPLV